MKKKPEIATKPTTNEPESSSVTATRIYQLALARILVEVEGLHSGATKPPKRYDRVDRIAYLAKQASTFAAEERKAAAAAAKQNGELTLMQVVAWLRQQPKDVQAQVSRELSTMEGRRGGVLG